MGRPRNPNRVATVQFNTRVTVGQMTAIQTLARLWADDLRAKGLPLLGDNIAAWFRSVVQKEAAAQGIEINEPGALPGDGPPAPETQGAAAPSAEPPHKASTRPRRP